MVDRTARTVIKAAAALGMAAAFALGGTPAAASSSVSAQSDQTTQVTCSGPRYEGTWIGTASFSNELRAGKRICNGNYSVWMQRNGDLVLRQNTTNRACWASETRAPGDAKAVFNGTIIGRPYIDIQSVSQGWVGRVVGSHNFSSYADNASVNSKGEFWVGYNKVGWC